MPYLEMLTKVKDDSWIRPVIQIGSKIEQFLPWSIPHPSIRFDDNQPRGFLWDPADIHMAWKNITLLEVTTNYRDSHMYQQTATHTSH